MNWTVRYFLHRERFWADALEKCPDMHPGARAYAAKMRRDWHVMAIDADRRFLDASSDYESPIHRN